MVRRTSTVRRRGLTAYKLVELLAGEIMYPLRGYDGYGDALRDQGRDSFTENYISDSMRQDWEANREALLAFWRSGKSAMTDTLAEGLEGASATAGKQFDRAAARRRLKPDPVGIN